MSTQGTIRRYTLIVEKVNGTNPPSIQELKDYLDNHGFEISLRTLQRNIEQIRYEFGIEIVYDRTKNGYYINKESSINLDSFLKFLEIAGTANLISESLKDGRETLSYISFESQGDLRGIENLKSLLFAIKKHRRISLTHINYETGKEKKYSMQPYHLKEYQNRWYLIGLLPGLDEFRTFGIDRISKIEVLSSTFKPDVKMNPSKLFENVVGLVYSENELEEVVLSYTPLQWKYAKALPLHKSQEMIRDNKREVIVKMNVIPNYELKQKILMLGGNVKVLKPKWFADDIKKNIRFALKQYL